MSRCHTRCSLNTRFLNWLFTISIGFRSFSARFVGTLMGECKRFQSLHWLIDRTNPKIRGPMRKYTDQPYHERTNPNRSAPTSFKKSISELQRRTGRPAFAAAATDKIFVCYFLYAFKALLMEIEKHVPTVTF